MRSSTTATGNCFEGRKKDRPFMTRLVPFMSWAVPNPRAAELQRPGEQRPPAIGRRTPRTAERGGGTAGRRRVVVLLVLLVLKQKMVKVMAVVMVLVLKKEREEEVPTARS